MGLAFLCGSLTSSNKFIARVLCDECAKCFLGFLTNHELIKLSGSGSWSDPFVSINEGQHEVVKMYFG